MRSVEREAVKVFDQNKEYYNIMRSWHQKAGGASLEDEVRDLLLKHAKGHVLDAGCGEGALVKWLLRHSDAEEVFGVDVSSTGVAMAKKSVKDKRAHFKKANLKRLPFTNNFFDFIVCHSVLEHVVNYPAALREFRRVLKPEGKLLIRLGNEYRMSKLRFLWNCVWGLNKSRPIRPSLKLRKGSVEDHMHNFDVNEVTSDTLLRDVKKTGFKIKYFSTGFKSYRCLPVFKKEPWFKKWGISFLTFAPFPFNHLGGLMIILGEKP